MLAGAGADLEDVAPVGEHALEYREDRLAIALASIREALQMISMRGAGAR